MPDLPAEPLFHKQHRRSDENGVKEELAPTAAALQVLVRQGVAAGLHRQPQERTGPQDHLPRKSDEPPSTNERSRNGTVQPYQALPPPKLPDTARLPPATAHHQPSHSWPQQPLPLPQPQFDRDTGVPLATGSQRPFGPPAPGRPS